MRTLAWPALLCMSACFATVGDPIIPPECSPERPCTAGLCRDGMCMIPDCPPGMRLEDGRCESFCTRNSECSGRCVDERCVPCRANDQCDGDQCIAGVCVAGCRADTECRPPDTCHRGVCGIPCADDPVACEYFVNEQLGRIGEGELPLARYATLGCQISTKGLIDNLCGPGRLPYSRETVPLCDPCLQSLGGCGLGQMCVQGDCTCETHEDCPDLACADGFCAPCIADEECGCGRYCSAGFCHDRCSSGDECPDGSVCAAGRCAPCDGDAMCPTGSRCYEDGCATTRMGACRLFERIAELAVPACER